MLDTFVRIIGNNGSAIRAARFVGVCAYSIVAKIIGAFVAVIAIAVLCAARRI